MAGFTASVPTSFVGTHGASTVTLTNYVKECNISGQAENYYTKLNNTKYDQDGGAIGFVDEMEIIVADTRRLSHFFRGALWTSVKVVYACEGPSAGASGFGTLAATIGSMRIESMNSQNDNGRMMMNVKAKLLSSDGTTYPVIWVHN